MGAALLRGTMAGAMEEPEPGRTYRVIVRREALKPGQRARAVALNHAPKPAPQPDEQADKAKDYEEFPQQCQN